MSFHPSSILVVALACSQLSAQPLPTPEQIKAEQASLETQRRALFGNDRAASGAAAGPSPALKRELERVEAQRRQIFSTANPALANTPNTFPSIATPERSEVDIEQLVKRYEQKGAARKSDGLMVFASFSMPRASLRQLIADTSAAGGVVVLRGFKDGSIKATSSEMALLGISGGGVQVNPQAFTKYRVAAVPAVVLVKPDAADAVDDEGCAFPDKYASVSGDVGLRYALEAIENRSPDFRDMAARYARPLKGRMK